MSDEQVDGTLIEAWARQEPPKDGSGDDDGGADSTASSAKTTRSEH